MPAAPPTAVLERRHPLTLAPGIPDRPVFEELLFSFADPDRLLSGGLAAPTLSLAIRSRAWAFIPGKHEQQDALNTLSEPTRNLTMAELPGGKRLVSLIDLGPDGEQVRLRDLGPRLSGTHGPLQRGLNSAIDFLHVPKPVAVLAASAAALGAIYQFGTGPATGLGMPVSLVTGGMFKNRLNASLNLASEPHFKNVRTDMSARFKLPLPQMKALRIEQLEVGGAVARTQEQGIIVDTRWANLRGRLSWLELCLGVHADRADPNLWMVLETNVQRDRLSVRGIINQQMNTGHSRMMATATLRTGPVLTGVFVGSNDIVKRTFGVIGMASF